MHAIGAPVMATVAEAWSRLAPMPKHVDSEPSARLLRTETGGEK